MTALDQRKVQKIILPGQSPEGEYLLSVLVKRSYDVTPGGGCTRADADEKLTMGDVHYGDPMNSTVQFESDLVPFKLATDVVFVGHAYAPGGAPAKTLRAALQVGGTRKEVLLVGDRVCHYRRGGMPDVTGPEPFTTMPLRYERAYGGVDIFSNPDLPCIYPRNHLGRGFVLQNTPKSVDKLALPNIEDPNDVLTMDRLFVGEIPAWERQPVPQGFGWFSKYWQPRASRAGVMPADRAVEQQMRAAYAQAIPPDQKPLYDQVHLPDMDFRFFNGASPGLAVPYLAGDEAVSLTNLTPEGSLAFKLPGERPHITLDLGRGLEEPPVVLHTVLIRMEDRQVDLVWRGAVSFPWPEELATLEKLEAQIQ